MNAEAICKTLRLAPEQRPGFIALLHALEDRERQRGTARADDVQADVTPERLAMAGDAIETFIADTGRRTVRVLDGSVLDLLMSRGKINADHYTAGMQFYSDWYVGGLANSGVIDPAKERVDGGTHKPQADEQLSALWSFVRAVHAIGHQLADPVISMVCFDETRASYCRRKYGQTQEQTANAVSTAVLLMGLAALVDHYRGPAPPTRQRTRASHVQPDWRPRIPDERKE